MFRNTMFRDAIITAMPDPVFVLSEDGEYIAIFGGQDAESYHEGGSLIGRNLSEVMEPQLVSQFLAVIKETIEKNTSTIFEYELSASDVEGLDPLTGPAGRIWFEARVSPFCFDGKNYVVWVARNITGTKNMELKLMASAASDALTGVYTRRFFFNELNSMFMRYSRNKSIYSVIIADIDDLKQINDEYGEKAGDLAIVNMVAAFKRILRKSDIMARIGGDEIAVILPDTGLDGASFLAERLKYAMEKTTMTTEGCTIAVSASFGCSEVSEEDTEYDAAAAKADIALHMAKLAGKKCVRTVK